MKASELTLNELSSPPSVDRRWNESGSLPPNVQQQLADVLDEYLVSVERGHPVDVNGLLGRYPELAGPLREYLDALELLHGASGLGFSAKLASTASEDLSTRRLGDYEIIREAGRGGMGVVYAAHQISLARKVALKVLPFAAVLDQKQILRFENEARAAAQLHRPNIVPVYGVGSDRGVHFYAMQFIEGRSLRDVIEEARSGTRDSALIRHSVDRSSSLKGTGASRAEASTKPMGAFPTHPTGSRHKHVLSLASLGVEAAEALHAAHECGVIHRDVKPSNLLLDRHGKLWVTDFGLARCQTNGSITNSGDVLGTLQYMSPEQGQGRSALVDQRTDIYSLGVTLYELLALRRPFEGENHATVVRQIELGQYKPIRQRCSSVPRDLENVITKAMAASREERYATAQDLADDLRRFIEGKPIRAKPPRISQHRVRVGVKRNARSRFTVLDSHGGFVRSKAKQNGNGHVFVASIGGGPFRWLCRADDGASRPACAASA